MQQDSLTGVKIYSLHLGPLVTYSSTHCQVTWDDIALPPTSLILGQERGSESPGFTHAGQTTSSKSTSFRRDPASLLMTSQHNSGKEQPNSLSIPLIHALLK